MSGSADTTPPTTYDHAEAIKVAQSVALTDQTQVTALPLGDAPKASVLPFNFWFDVGQYVESRRFVSGTGNVCLDVKVYKYKGSGPTDNRLEVRMWEDISFGEDRQIGPEVIVPVDDRWYTWCFHPTTNGPEYYFSFGYYLGNGNAWAHGDGTARPG